MDVVLGVAASLGGLAMIIVVLTVYGGVRRMEERQTLILERLEEIVRRLEDG